MYLNRKNRNGLVSWQLHQLTLPRIQMSIILSLTGFVGFLCSFSLLHSGVSQMWIRYPLSILAAYITFLLLLRLWLSFQRLTGDFDLGTNLDFPIGGGIDASISGADFNFGGGRDFSGGGAGGSWGESVSPSSGGGSSVVDGISFDLDLEGIIFLIIVLLALFGAAIATLYVIYIAPILLAEILVDGLLLHSLQKKMKTVAPNHWLQTAVWRTLPSALFCILFFGIAGGALHFVSPKAKSVGEVWTFITTPKSPKLNIEQ